MELQYYLKILSRYWKWIFGIASLFALVAGIVSYYWPVQYRSQLTLYVQRIPEEPKLGDYSYDGYYAQQTAEAYTDTVEGLLEARDIIRQALEAAQMPVSAGQIRFVANHLKVEKVAPQLVSVSLTTRSQQDSTKLVSAIAQVLQEKIKTLNRQGNGGVVISLVDVRPLESVVSTWLGLNMLVAFLGGIAIATVGVSLREYLRD